MVERELIDERSALAEWEAYPLTLDAPFLLPCANIPLMECCVLEMLPVLNRETGMRVPLAPVKGDIALDVWLVEA